MMAAVRAIAAVLRGWLPDNFKAAARPLLLLLRRRAARKAIAAPMPSASRRRRYRATPRQVVFLSEVPRVREAKLAEGLRSLGWRPVLLYGQPPNYELGRYFDEVVPFADPEDALRKAFRYSPVAYHLFSPSGDLASTYAINARPGPTVFDTTDLLGINYLVSPAKLHDAQHAIDMQVHGIRHADGYCARDLQYQLAERRLGYRRAGPVIFFPEYCWGVAHEAAAARPPGCSIRCVQAGNFGIEKRGENDWGYLEIGKKFIQAGVGLELYPNYTHFGRGQTEFQSIFSEYLDLARTSPLFSLHRPVSADALMQTLRAYDFGVAIMWADVNGEPARTYNPELLPYFMASRVFDYLDAGLPVVLNRRFRLIHAMLRRYGVGVPVDAAFMTDIRGHLEPLATPEMKRRAVRASRGLAVARHAHRLARFYEQLAGRVGMSAG